MLDNFFYGENMDNAKSSFNVEKGYEDVKGAAGAEIWCVYSGALKNR